MPHVWDGDSSEASDAGVDADGAVDPGVPVDVHDAGCPVPRIIMLRPLQEGESLALSYEARFALCQ